MRYYDDANDFRLKREVWFDFAHHPRASGFFINYEL